MPEKQYREIGARLRSLRAATAREQETQREYAGRHGFTATAWNNWEIGAGRITVDAAVSLCEAYGITLDWIYRGRRDGLSDSMRNRL